MYDKQHTKCKQMLSANGNVLQIMKNLTQFVDRAVEEGSSTAIVVWRAHLQLQAKKIMSQSKHMEAEALCKTRLEIRCVASCKLC